MQLPAWTKKVFAPVLSSSPSTTSFLASNTFPTATTSSPATTSTPSTFSSQIPNDDLAKSKGSIQSYLSFSTLPNVRKRIPLLGVPDANANSSTTSLMSAIFFSHIRDPRASSCPEISKTSSSIVEGSTKPAVMDLERNDNGDDSVDEEEDEEVGEDVLDSPTTTTIYYYPPRPKKQSTETSPSPSPSSSPSSNKPTNTNSSPRFANSDPEVRCLRHIGLIPSAASASSPEVNYIRQHYQYLTHTHKHHLYHDKDCEFAHRSALEPSGERPTSKRNTDPRQQGRDNLFLPLSPLQINPPSGDKPDPDPDLSPSATSPPPSIPKFKSPIAVVPPFFDPPAHYQVRRSSANYSLEALKNKKRENNSSSTSRPISRISDTTIASSTSSNSSSGSNSSGRPQLAEDTVQKLRESIRSMSNFGSTSSSSSSTSKQATTSTSKVQSAVKSGDPAVAVSNSDVPSPRAVVTTGAASHLPSPCPPRNSPLISRAIQVLASDANTSTTTTTTTVTTITTAPANTENKLEHLIQKIDTLTREVEIMKQQRSYYNNSSSSNGNSDAPLQTKNRNKARNLSTVSLPSPSTLSLKALAAKNNSASSLTFSFPPPPPPPPPPSLHPANNNNNNNPTPPSHLPTLPPFRISGNNMSIMHPYNNESSSGRGMTRLQNLPPPPSERPPSPPTYSASSSSCSSLSTPSSCSSSSLTSSTISFSSFQRGDTNPSRDEASPSLPPSRIPIPHAQGHQRPISSINRSFSVLFPSPPTTPSFAPTNAGATPTNYTRSMNNVHPKRVSMITASATTTTTDDIDEATITPPSNSATPVVSSALTSMSHSDDEDVASTAYFMTNNNNTSITKEQDQEQQNSESTVISRAESRTPAPPTVPPPPPPRSYLTTTSSNNNSKISEQTMTGMTGPPRRPPRPPQLSVDMKDILLLMDSRLGATVAVDPLIP